MLVPVIVIDTDGERVLLVDSVTVHEAVTDTEGVTVLVLLSVCVTVNEAVLLPLLEAVTVIVLLALFDGDVEADGVVEAESETVGEGDGVRDAVAVCVIDGVKDSEGEGIAELEGVAVFVVEPDKDIVDEIVAVGELDMLELDDANCDTVLETDTVILGVNDRVDVLVAVAVAVVEAEAEATKLIDTEFD